MTTVAVSELHDLLADCLKRVRAGDQIVLTEEGLPVARLVPITQQSHGDGPLADAIANGLVQPPTIPLTQHYLERLPFADDPEGFTLKALLEERESGW